MGKEVNGAASGEENEVLRDRTDAVMEQDVSEAVSNVKALEWLAGHLDDPGVVIVDCRFVLGSPEAGRQSFELEHILGAVYVDLEQDLSAPKGIHGGRHPLPGIVELSAKLSKIGIDASKQVIAYDNQGGAMASRLWWLLQFLGHSQVFVLDGGFGLWKQAGYPVTSTPTVPASANFVPVVRENMVVDMEDVKGKLGLLDQMGLSDLRDLHAPKGIVLVDSREEPRYKGLVEPIDPIAGHIPGAVNYFWKESLTPEGRWRSAEELQMHFKEMDYDKEIIVYCGSGVTACPNILALQEAGYSNVKLYAGSWSDWVSYPDNSVATGEE